MPLADGPLITPAAGKCAQAENGRLHRQTGTFTRARRLAPADGGAPTGLAITRAGVASAAARNARPAHSGAVTPPSCPYQICMDVASRWLNPGFNGDRLVGHAASREADVDEVIHPVELESDLSVRSGKRHAAGATGGEKIAVDQRFILFVDQRGPRRTDDRGQENRFSSVNSSCPRLPAAHSGDVWAATRG